MGRHGTCDKGCEFGFWCEFCDGDMPEDEDWGDDA